MFVTYNYLRVLNHVVARTSLTTLYTLYIVICICICMCVRTRATLLFYAAQILNCFQGFIYIFDHQVLIC